MAYLLEEDYEGDMSRWVIDDGSNGIVDPTYTTNPIFGSRSLRMKDDTTVGTYCVTRIDPDAGYNEFYAFFSFKPVDLPSSDSEIWQTYNLQAADTDYSDIEPHEIIMVTTDGR